MLLVKGSVFSLMNTYDLLQQAGIIWDFITEVTATFGVTFTL